VIVEAAAASFGYLLGSVPVTPWLARKWAGVDLARSGSGNPGATNVFRTVGTVAALVAFALDAGKGAIAVLGVGWAGAETEQVLVLAAAGAVLGHVWPLFSRFRGGKGVATSAGAWAVLCLPALAIAFAVFVGVVVVTRRVSAASVAAGVALPIGLLGLRSWTDVAVGSAPIAYGFLLAGLLVWTHRENIARLVAGREPPVF